jgi:hypothetical protein
VTDYDEEFFTQQETSPRENVRQSINRYCATTGKSHSFAWRRLYLEFEDKIGVRVPDENGLDAIEQAGLMTELLKVAKTLWGKEPGYADEVNGSIPDYIPGKMPDEEATNGDSSII